MIVKRYRKETVALETIFYNQQFQNLSKDQQKYQEYLYCCFNQTSYDYFYYIINNIIITVILLYILITDILSPFTSYQLLKNYTNNIKFLKL